MSGLAYDLFARVRGKIDSFQDVNHGDSEQVGINPRGDLLVAQALPALAELVRMRSSYMVIAAAAVAPVAALPTTAAHLTLWNGEQDNGKLYIVDSIGVFITVSAGAATAFGVVGCMNIGKKTGPASGLTAKGLAGQVYRGTGTMSVGQAITDDKWTPYGTHVVGPTSQLAAATDWPLNGLIVIPPGHMFSIAAVANTAATITTRCFMRWHEVQLPVG